MGKPASRVAPMPASRRRWANVEWLDGREPDPKKAFWNAQVCVWKLGPLDLEVCGKGSMHICLGFCTALGRSPHLEYQWWSDGKRKENDIPRNPFCSLHRSFLWTSNSFFKKQTNKPCSDGHSAVNYFAYCLIEHWLSYASEIMLSCWHTQVLLFSHWSLPCHARFSVVCSL